MRLLWLPAVLRSAGLIVHEVDGWKTRGADTFGPVRGITCHHTAGSRTSTDAGEIRTLLHGSTSAPPPIAQLYLSRTGAWHVIASGLCFHNKIGWGGPNKGFGNDALLGIEAQHSGAGEVWTDVQYLSYVRGVAALVAHKATGWAVPVAHVAGHKEHQPGAKTDPSFDMDRFRADVARMLAGEDDMSSEVVKGIQTAVKAAGHDPGPVDGVWGPKTQAALTAALKTRGAAGPPGPAGPAGPRGEAGPAGPPGSLPAQVAITGRLDQLPTGG